MRKRTITYKDSVICFSCGGLGEKLLFCFHGFGEEGSSFSMFERILGTTYTLVAPDFPFHGETEWKQGLLLTPTDLINIIRLIAEQFETANYSKDKFSILAYSMGGRIAFHLFQMMPEKIDKMVLAAPDGLKMNFWYWLGTQTWAGNRLFEFTMHRPYWFFAVVQAGNKTGLVNKSVTKFVHHYIDDKTARINLFRRWTTMRKFKPDFRKIIEIIRSRKIPVTLVFGSYDRIILSRRSDFLVAGTENITIKVIQAGHQLLKEKYAAEIASSFSG